MIRCDAIIFIFKLKVRNGQIQVYSMFDEVIYSGLVCNDAVYWMQAKK